MVSGPPPPGPPQQWWGAPGQGYGRGVSPGGYAQGWGPPGPAGAYGPQWAAPAQAPARDGRLATLGIVCLVFGILKVLWVLYQVGTSAFAVFAFEAMISVVHATGVALPLAANKAIALVEDLVFVTAFTTMGRALPFAVLGAVQIYLGAKLHGGNAAALWGLRKLVWWSLGAILLSLLVQAVFVIPAQVEFARRLLDDVLTAVPWPGGVSPVATWTPPSPLWAITRPVLMAIAQATWPVALWIWTGQLMGGRPRATA